MLEYRSSKYHEKIPRDRFYCTTTFLLHAHCRVSLPPRIHGHTECDESAFQQQNVGTERKMRQKDVFHVKIIEKYPAAFKNPTSHGAKFGTFPSKNTTRNRKFHENPTPRWEFLKSHEVEPHVWVKLYLRPPETGSLIVPVPRPVP